MANPNLLQPHYRIELIGQVDVAWLQGFDSSVAMIADKARHTEEVTVIRLRLINRGWLGCCAGCTDWE